MKPNDIVVFATALFFALTALIMWKRRRDLATARINRGLRGYVAAGNLGGLAMPGQTDGENLIPV